VRLPAGFGQRFGWSTFDAIEGGNRPNRLAGPQAVATRNPAPPQSALLACRLEQSPGAGQQLLNPFPFRCHRCCPMLLRQESQSARSQSTAVGDSKGSAGRALRAEMVNYEYKGFPNSRTGTDAFFSMPQPIPPTRSFPAPTWFALLPARHLGARCPSQP